MSPDRSANRSEIKSTRLEAFSDGVIAVIITIMVLELHVPRQNGPAGLWSVVPQLCIYLLSFFTIGIYWINHHDLIRRTESVDYRILWTNLIFLFVLSLIPYFVDYLGQKSFDSFSTLLYDLTMLVTGAAFFLLRRSVMRRQRQTGELRRADMAELSKHIACMGIYLAAIAVAFYRPWLSLALTGLVTFVWIIPGLLVKTGDEDGTALNRGGPGSRS